MTNKIKGIIFYSKVVKDSDLYIKVLSSSDKIISGIAYGGNSSKKKIIYQNGYFIDFSITQKNDNAPPIFLSEISKPYIGNIFEDKYKLNALLSILNLVKLSIVEGQTIKGLYNAVENLMDKIIYENHWIVFYCEWLFHLLTLIGYQIDYCSNVKKNYFNLTTQKFENSFQHNSIQFPHNLFSIDQNINFKNINTVFIIFESIFLKNHLDTNNYKMFTNYLNFKNLILNQLKNYSLLVS
jgi:recombinational DNA repair protein (RecF pathway)